MQVQKRKQRDRLMQVILLGVLLACVMTLIRTVGGALSRIVHGA
jgi:hypothetical protein